jgi:multidrug efflux system outer membrane protein
MHPAPREESLKLIQIQEQGGVVSLLDVRQAEQLVFTAAETITDAERRMEQQEDALSTLLGRNPGPIPRGLALADQPQPPDVPAGLPSSLLELGLAQARLNELLAMVQLYSALGGGWQP